MTKKAAILGWRNASRRREVVGHDGMEVPNFIVRSSVAETSAAMQLRSREGES